MINIDLKRIEIIPLATVSSGEGGSANADLSNYYTKEEVNTKLQTYSVTSHTHTEYLKGFNLGRNDDENFQVDDGIVNIYTEMYDGSYDVAIDGTSVFGIKPLDNSIILEIAGGTGNGNIRCGVKVNPEILSGEGGSYDDTSIVNRISALESEISGVAQQINELNGMIV